MIGNSVVVAISVIIFPTPLVFLYFNFSGETVSFSQAWLLTILMFVIPYIIFNFLLSEEN